MYVAFPRSDYYGPSAPLPGHQQTACLPAAALAGRQVGGPGNGSHVHHAPVDGGGAQLFPCSLVTVTPQTFTVTTEPNFPISTRCCLSWLPNRPALLSGPDPPGSSRRILLRGFHRWFLHSYTVPSCSPNPVRLAVPNRPGFVRAAPVRSRASGSDCPQLHRIAATIRRWSPFISTRCHGASWRTGK
jgi:hypothetical protein